jgi:hypothetical protein
MTDRTGLLLRAVADGHDPISELIESTDEAKLGSPDARFDHPMLRCPADQRSIVGDDASSLFGLG